MKSFLAACIAAIVIAVGGWLVLERIQQPVTTAYTSVTGARI